MIKEDVRENEEVFVKAFYKEEERVTSLSIFTVNRNSYVFQNEKVAKAVIV